MQVKIYFIIYMRVSKLLHFYINEMTQLKRQPVWWL